MRFTPPVPFAANLRAANYAIFAQRPITLLCNIDDAASSPEGSITQHCSPGTVQPALFSRHCSAGTVQPELALRLLGPLRIRILRDHALKSPSCSLAISRAQLQQ